MLMMTITLNLTLTLTLTPTSTLSLSLTLTLNLAVNSVADKLADMNHVGKCGSYGGSNFWPFY